MALSARTTRIPEYTTPIRDRRRACNPEYPHGEYCLRWLGSGLIHARGNLGVRAEEDVIR